MESVDYFVIGGGSGGVRSARIAAQYGAKVVLADPDPLGGTCVNRGCIPKKIMVFAADYARSYADARGFGWDIAKPSFNWQDLSQRRDAELARINQVYRANLEKAGARWVPARARLAPAGTTTEGEIVETEDGQRFHARHVLVATGGYPARQPIPGAELALTSDEIFNIEDVPKRLIVIGAGYIGLEFASIFHYLGSKVTVLHRGTRLLSGFDAGAAAFLAEALQTAGIDIRLGATPSEIEATDVGSRLVRLTDGTVLEADIVLAATGRVPNTKNLGIEDRDLTNARGAIEVDPETYRSKAPAIYAVGDVIDRVNLTPAAIKQGHLVADMLFGGQNRQIDLSFVPTAVYTLPPLACAGMSEEQAKAKGHSFAVFEAHLRPLRSIIAGRDERVLFKLLVEDGSDRVLGVHMVGGDAPEIIQGLGVALTAGATKAHFDATLAIHPTLAEEFVLLREPARHVSPD